MSKVRMAILGCGNMSGGHAQRYKTNPDVEIVALCDVSEAAVETYAERFLADVPNRPATFTDAAEMYRATQPDAVTIVTPHTMHFEHGMQALAAGCHVFMEKPMVTDSRQAKQLAAAVKESGKLLVIGYNTPCTPNFQYLRNIVREGRLGKLETVTAWQAQNWRERTTGTWRQNPALSGGGQMYDSGAHILNSLVWTVEQNIEQVSAFVDNVGTPVDVNGIVNIKFVDGTFATVTIAGNCTNEGCGMYLTFERGRVEIDAWDGLWMRVFTAGDGELRDLGIEGHDQTPNENFIDAILGRAEPQTTPLNGVIQSQLMDAIYESAATGQFARPVNEPAEAIA